MTTLSLTRTVDGTTSDVDANLNNNWTEIEDAVNGSLDSGNLATDSVGSAEIQALAVGTGELADNAVTQAKMGDGAVGTAEILDDNVTVAKILQGSNGALLSSAGGTTAWSAVGAAGEVLVATGSNVEWNPLSSRVLNQTGTLAEIVSSSTQTTIYTFTVPANTMGANGCLQLLMRGDYLNNTGSNQTLGLACLFGGTTWYGDTKTAIATSGSRRAIFLELLIGNKNATGSQAAHGMFHQTSSTGAAVAGVGTLDQTATAPSYFMFNDQVGLSIDTTAAKDFVVQFKHSASSAQLSIRMQYAVLLVHTT